MLQKPYLPIQIHNIGQAIHSIIQRSYKTQETALNTDNSLMYSYYIDIDIYNKISESENFKDLIFIKDDNGKQKYYDRWKIKYIIIDHKKQEAYEVS